MGEIAELSQVTWHPVVKGAVMGALTGLASAAVVDFNAFRSWKNFSDAYSYDWPLAYWRWLQGTVTGAITGATTAAGIELI